MEELSYVDESAHFWSVGDRKRVFNTVMMIYRHYMSSGLQEYVLIWTLFDSLWIFLPQSNKQRRFCLPVNRWRPGQKYRAACHKRQHIINLNLRVLPMCPEWLRLSPGLPSPAEAGALTAHAGLTILQPPCWITWDITVETSWRIGKKNCQILRCTHSKLCYMQ